MLRILVLGLLNKIRGAGVASSGTSLFFSTQLGNYCACLLVAMMVNSAAGMVGVPWLINRGITEGASILFLIRLHALISLARFIVYCTGSVYSSSFAAECANS
jgi:hypothetical protein